MKNFYPAQAMRQPTIHSMRLMPLLPVAVTAGTRNTPEPMVLFKIRPLIHNQARTSSSLLVDVKGRSPGEDDLRRRDEAQVMFLVNGNKL